MNDYNLEANELVIMQEDSVCLVERSGEIELEEIVLTNLNLILVRSVSQGLFKRSSFLKKLPLEHILNDEGVPQVIVSNIRDKFLLQLPFKDEAIALRFSDETKLTASHWADAIRKAAVGSLSDIKTSSSVPPELAGLVDGARGVIDMFRGGPKPKEAVQQTSAPSKPSHASGKCVGCHAPLTGKRGTVVTCKYCDTSQTL